MAKQASTDNELSPSGQRDNLDEGDSQALVGPTYIESAGEVLGMWRGVSCMFEVCWQPSGIGLDTELEYREVLYHETEKISGHATVGGLLFQRADGWWEATVRCLPAFGSSLDIASVHNWKRESELGKVRLRLLRSNESDGCRKGAYAPRPALEVQKMQTLEGISSWRENGAGAGEETSIVRLQQPSNAFVQPVDTADLEEIDRLLTRGLQPTPMQDWRIGGMRDIEKSLESGDLSFLEASLTRGAPIAQSQTLRVVASRDFARALEDGDIKVAEKLLDQGVKATSAQMEHLSALRSFTGTEPCLISLHERLSSVVCNRPDEHPPRPPPGFDALVKLLGRHTPSSEDSVDALLPRQDVVDVVRLKAALAHAAGVVEQACEEFLELQDEVRRNPGDIALQQRRDERRRTYSKTLQDSLASLYVASLYDEADACLSLEISSAGADVQARECQLNGVISALQSCLREAEGGSIESAVENATTEEALDAFEAWVHLCAGKDVIAQTDTSADVARTALCAIGLRPCCDASSSRELASSLRALASAVAAEEILWASKPSENFTCGGKLLAAGRDELRSFHAQLDILSSTLEVTIRYKQEIAECERASDVETSRDPLMRKFEVALEERIESYEAHEDAEIAFKRAQRRGKVDDGLAEKVTNTLQIARKCDASLREIAAQLAREIHAFPEVATLFKEGLPPELLLLWVPERTMSIFSEQELLPVHSRNRVYRVVDDGEVFAIKQFALTSESLGICYREAAILRRLRHPHIAELLAVFEDPSTSAVCLQFPFYEHGQLDDWVRHKQPDMLAVRRVLWQAAQAIEHLHAHQVVHSDIKPSNILVDGNGRARLADFDVSVDAASRTSIARATRVGYSPGFAAPELTATGATCAADVFAFGEVAKLVVEESEERDAFVSTLQAVNPSDRPSMSEVLQHAFFAPVSSWREDFGRTCCIMASDFCCKRKGQCRLSDGVECQASSSEEGHFVCRACLEQHVIAALQLPLRVQTEREARVFCPKYPCECNSCPFDDCMLARSLTPETFKLYISARVDLLERRKASELEREMRNQLAAELERLATADAEQRKVCVARNHINEEILLCKCPRCGQAFIDFEGCFALKCSRCSCAFCAWCLADGGDSDAHRHVRSCREKPASADTFFGSAEQFREAQARRQRRLLAEYLPTLEERVRRQVCSEMRKALNGLVDDL
eukprot:TRINITY_DN71224_c0_g1_i1.p1 TRINITY_DN71224_c0_g1~~TRINITY_DN71224_c0_g1_i1.p1  ORF type:complete len:1363 (-),score=227.25 TRINITY_DN71224_c0_g1_i1:302-3889(-)